MDIYLYVSGISFDQRVAIEELLEERLSTNGEVTGAGSGADKCNIDIEINQGTLTKKDALRLVGEVLTDRGVEGAYADVDQIRYVYRNGIWE